MPGSMLKVAGKINQRQPKYSEGGFSDWGAFTKQESLHLTHNSISTFHWMFKNLRVKTPCRDGFSLIRQEIIVQVG